MERWDNLGGLCEEQYFAGYTPAVSKLLQWEDQATNSVNLLKRILYFIEIDPLS